jgi:hypothetical protein
MRTYMMVLWESAHMIVQMEKSYHLLCKLEPQESWCFPKA